MKNWFGEIQLEGELVSLVPLQDLHKNDLLAAAADGSLWELWYTSVPSDKNIDNYIQEALRQKDTKAGYPFAVFHKPSGKFIGSTRYCNAATEHRRLEIGYTWYAKSFQRTGVNTECKFLLLKHAFEYMNCIAVEFKTNFHNFKSRTAISRLGAKQDGILRNHRINPDGSYRDSVVFSITNHEWPNVKRTLDYEMKRFADHK